MCITRVMLLKVKKEHSCVSFKKRILVKSIGRKSVSVSNDQWLVVIYTRSWSKIGKVSLTVLFCRIKLWDSLFLCYVQWFSICSEWEEVSGNVTTTGVFDNGRPVRRRQTYRQKRMIHRIHYWTKSSSRNA